MLRNPRVRRAHEASIPWLDTVKLLVDYGADPEIHVVRSCIEDRDGERVREIRFEGSASGAIRHYVENGEWTTAEQRAELLDYAKELEEQRAKAQNSSMQTVDVADRAKALVVQDKRAKEKGGNDTSVKRSTRRTLKNFFKW